MRIYLNGNAYELKAGTRVQATPLAEWPVQYRTSGLQSRTNRANSSSWQWDDWSKGLGIKIMDINDADDVRSFYDSHLWTHIERQITLRAMFITPTIDTSVNVKPTAFFNKEAQLYALVQGSGYFVGSAGASIFKYYAPSNSFATHNIVGRFGTATTLLRGIIDLESYDEDILLTLDNNGNGLQAGNLAILKGIASHTAIFNSGVSFYGDSAIPFPLGTLGLVGALVIGTKRSLIVVPTLTSPTISIGSTGTQLENIASLSFGGVPSNYPTRTGQVIRKGNDTYIGVAEGLYQVTPNRCVPVIDWRNTYEPSPQLALYNELIYAKVGKQLIEYNPDTGSIKDKGFNRRQGLSSRDIEDTVARVCLDGEITALYPTWKYLLVGVMPGSGYMSEILLYDGSQDAWHLLALCPSTNLAVSRMYLSTLPDGAERLWVIWRNIAGNHNNEYPSFIFNPLTNPLLAATHAYATGGLITFPTFDGGLPEVKTFWAKVSLAGRGLGGNNDAILRAVLGNSIGLNTLGTTNTIPYYSLINYPDGYISNSIQVRLDLGRGTMAATGPVINSLTLDYQKIPSTRMSYAFEVDPIRTTDKEQRSIENLISDLEAVRDFSAPATFWYGRIGTKMVKVDYISNLEDVLASDDFEGERQGIIAMKVSQVT